MSDELLGHLALAATKGAIADEERRWRWVLRETGRVALLPDVDPIRSENPLPGEGLLEHLRWLVMHGANAPELTGRPEKAMRWACWAQGALVALGRLKLDDCKRLNMRATWEGLQDR